MMIGHMDVSSSLLVQVKQGSGLAFEQRIKIEGVDCQTRIAGHLAPLVIIEAFLNNDVSHHVVQGERREGATQCGYLLRICSTDQLNHWFQREEVRYRLWKMPFHNLSCHPGVIGDKPDGWATQHEGNFCWQWCAVDVNTYLVSVGPRDAQIVALDVREHIGAVGKPGYVKRRHLSACHYNWLHKQPQNIPVAWIIL